MLPSILVQGQQVKIAFNNDNTILLHGISLGHLEAIEGFSFMIDTRLRRVKIFGLSFFEDPSPKSNHPLMEVENVEENPPPKSIVPTLSQSRVSGFFLRKD